MSTGSNRGAPQGSFSDSYAVDTAQRYSVAVVETVADAVGCDPLELPEPLYTAVDPDVLDRLFPRCEDGLSLSFVYCGYRITVQPGEVVVTDP